ncbi:endo-1,5-alpha-L-arabinosidase [Choiromyces venosus 120613-1]|uniref:arabinan endo-1,5-alpha-L-arabinosidase n=1 Tax=Choiromyces venosus 120613-1 TaxID=1336337 RepID=A0A3N4JLI6_9PEZI|nr:endo-1,5-alpha-L-arabinosidase [Choiromyces venosus 120613-1]
MLSISRLTTLLLAAASLATCAPSGDPFSPDQWPNPPKVFGDGSDWGGIHIHDPSLVKKDKYYYSFGTHLRVTICRAPTLNGPWERLGSVLPDQSKIEFEGRNDTWAPDVVKIGNTYHCYYPVSTFGSQDSGIGLATSESLLPGTWTDHGLVARSYSSGGTSPWNIVDAIDPNVIYDRKSEKWLLPYMFFSHGFCCGSNASMPAAGEEYKIKIGRSESAQGPFVDRAGVDLLVGGGDVVFGSHGWVYGPGGQGVLGGGDRDVLYHHHVDTRVSYIDEDKFLGWNEIRYVQGWPVLV